MPLYTGNRSVFPERQSGKDSLFFLFYRDINKNGEAADEND